MPGRRSVQRERLKEERRWLHEQHGAASLLRQPDRFRCTASSPTPLSLSPALGPGSGSSHRSRGGEEFNVRTWAQAGGRGGRLLSCAGPLSYAPLGLKTSGRGEPNVMWIANTYRQPPKGATTGVAAGSSPLLRGNS
jgi:hypothetical protein